MTHLHRAAEYLWKLPVSGLSFSAASIAAAAILTVAGLHAPAMPVGADAQKSGLILMALCPLLAFGLAPLAAGLSGNYRVRWFALALLVFINLGVNTAIEGAIFSMMFAKGGAAFLILIYAGAAAAFGSVLARFFGPAAEVAAAKPRRGPGSWAWRIALALLAFPVTYLTFGTMVAPIVVERYRAGVAGLVLPSMSVILPVEVVRSALFLLASAPAIFLWRGSRPALVLALGWAHAVTVGLYPLLGAYWFPAVLRVTHSLEITADSFAYAFVIVMLLKARVTATNPIARTAGPIESATAA